MNQLSLSPGGYYRLTLSAATGTGYTLTAGAVTGKGQESDGACATMSVTVLRGAPTHAPATCWGR